MGRSSTSERITVARIVVSFPVDVSLSRRRDLLRTGSGGVLDQEAWGLSLERSDQLSEVRNLLEKNGGEDGIRTHDTVSRILP